MKGVAFWPVGALRASEEVCPDHVMALVARIIRTGMWTHPIPVCERTGLVMDGNHRLQAAQHLELVRVPVIPLNYNDVRIVVRDRKHGGLFDRSRFQAVVEHGYLLPYKTTAHEFDISLPTVALHLDCLRAAETCRVAFLDNALAGHGSR